jgi:hypothetical protein
MKCFLLILTLLLLANSAAAQNSDWTGVYTFDEESWDETRARTSYWFRLEIKKAAGRLVGIYSDGVNGRVARRFRFAVKTEDRRARFFFERPLPLVEGAEDFFDDRRFVRGELLFEFEESTANGKPVIYTIWRKMNLAARTETGSSAPKSVFFRKAFSMCEPERRMTNDELRMTNDE